MSSISNSDITLEVGRLIAGQEMMLASIGSLAKSVEKISDTQQMILEIQAKHSSNAELIEKNSKAIEKAHRRIDPLELEMGASISFRKIVAKVFWIVITPILAGASITAFVVLVKNI